MQTLLVILLSVSSAFAQVSEDEARRAAEAAAQAAAEAQAAMGEQPMGDPAAQRPRAPRAVAPVRRVAPASPVAVARPSPGNEALNISASDLQKCLLSVSSSGVSSTQPTRVRYGSKNYQWNGHEILDLSNGSIVWSKTIDQLKPTPDNSVTTANIKKAVLVAQFEKAKSAQIKNDGDVIGATIQYSQFRDCQGNPLKLADGKTIGELTNQKLTDLRKYYPGIERGEVSNRPARNRAH